MTGNEIRRIIIQQAYKSGENHISSALCIADILAVLYTNILRPQDRFVLSKGHAALALYAALYLSGRISVELLNTYCTGTPSSYTSLRVHPDYRTPGVEFSTGSLGQGITYAVGQALALKRLGSDGRVYCLVSDAECQEGSVWEAAALAVRLKLDNLFVIVDNNKMGAMGTIIDGLLEKFNAFGFSAVKVDGHNLDMMCSSLTYNLFPGYAPSPLVVVCNTLPGKGVSFMEDAKLKWHYQAMNETEYQMALRELSQ